MPRRVENWRSVRTARVSQGWVPLQGSHGLLSSRPVAYDDDVQSAAPPEILLPSTAVVVVVPLNLKNRSTDLSARHLHLPALIKHLACSIPVVTG